MGEKKIGQKKVLKVNLHKTGRQIIFKGCKATWDLKPTRRMTSPKSRIFARARGATFKPPRASHDFT